MGHSLGAGEPADHEVTRELEACRSGDAAAAERLYPLVVQRLRAVAMKYLRRQGSNPLLQPTMIVDEAFMRLVPGGCVNWQNRRHFHAVAARAIRQILCEWARYEAARNGTQARLDPDELADGKQLSPPVLLELDDALCRLAELNPRWARIVELRFFSGLTCKEAAGALGVSLRTVEGEWRFARTWLHQELAP